MMKQYMRGIVKCVLGIGLLLVFWQETMGVTMASTVSGNTINVSGSDLIDTAMVCGEVVSDNGILQLQVPENIDFVIDPWQIAERGQVYSEKFIIKNCGTGKGILYLEDIVCWSGDAENIVIIKDKNEILEDDEKKIYLEMQFDNEEFLVLSQEKQQFCIEMDQGDEITFWITGNINSKVAHQWKDGDVTISLKYRYDVH